MQRLRRLLGRRSARLADGCFVVEGTKVLSEALSAAAAVESVYVDPSAGAGELAVVQRAMDAGCRVFELEAGVIERVAGTVTPQALLAVVGTVDVPLATLRPGGPGPVVVCVDVRDPGNAGTVLRSAEASGAAAVVLCEGAVDVYNAKTVRASAGALFHVPVVVGGAPGEVLDHLGGCGMHRLGTVAHHGDSYTDVDLTKPVALVLGNEGKGLPDGVVEHLDGLVTIPMAGRSESLNVGMAAAVLCFEAARQRRATVVADA